MGTPSLPYRTCHAPYGFVLLETQGPGSSVRRKRPQAEDHGQATTARLLPGLQSAIYDFGRE